MRLEKTNCLNLYVGFYPDLCTEIVVLEIHSTYNTVSRSNFGIAALSWHISMEPVIGASSDLH